MKLWNSEETGYKAIDFYRDMKRLDESTDLKEYKYLNMTFKEYLKEVKENKN